MRPRSVALVLKQSPKKEYSVPLLVKCDIEDQKGVYETEGKELCLIDLISEIVFTKQK